MLNIHPIYNKKALPQEWKESVIVPVYNKIAKVYSTECTKIPKCSLHHIQRMWYK
jgi:hypothetical protein